MTLGQIDHPDSFDISLTNASHAIKRVLVDKFSQDILLDVKFLSTPQGPDAQQLIEYKNYKFGVRASGTSDHIKKIFTWDIIANEEI